MLRAVIFDMDATLVDWSGFNADWPTLVEQRMSPVSIYLQSRGLEAPLAGQIAQTYVSHARSAWDAVDGPEWHAPREAEILHAALAQLGVDVKQLDPYELISQYAFDLLPGVRAYPDSIEVLRRLRAAGLRCGLLTNAGFPMWMRDRELKALGMLEYLDERLTAADVGRTKPHPAPFEALLSRLDVAPHEAVFVGDNPRDDVAGAQSVGIRAVWVQRSGELPADVRPNAIIQNLAELLLVLDRWFPGWQERAQ